MKWFAVLGALVLSAFLSARAVAEPQPGGFRIVEARVAENKLTWSETKYVAQAKEVAVEVEVNGMKVVEKRTVKVTVPVTATQSLGLKELKATDATGKAIDADKLTELLKEPLQVVLLSGPISDKQRGLFKDKTVFVEVTQPEPKVPAPVEKAGR